MDDFLTPARVEPKSIQHVPLTEAIIEMVSAGLGVAPFARWLIEPYMRTHGLRLLRLGPGGAQRDWQLAAREGDPRKGEFARLAKALRSSLPQQIPFEKQREYTPQQEQSVPLRDLLTTHLQ
ncbi:MAG: LysR substrate-binding domain-containing protein [Terriglobia bacterium]